MSIFHLFENGPDFQGFQFIWFQLHNEHNWFLILVTFSKVCYSFGLLFIMCELGERATNSIGEISDKINELDWYSYPLEIQKRFTTILIIAQQPVFFECFGSIYCTRESFKKVSFNHWFEFSTNKINKRIFEIFFSRTLIAHFHISWCYAGLAIKTINLTNTMPLNCYQYSIERLQVSYIFWYVDWFIKFVKAFDSP